MNYPYYPQMPQMNMPQSYNQQSQGMMIATEEEVLKYPVAPGNSIPFKIDGQPLIIEKSMGMSQFDTPKYRRYRLVEEGVTEQAEDKPQYISKAVYDENKRHTDDDIKEIRNNIEEFTAQMYDELDSIKKLINRNRVKKESGNE